MQASLLEHHPSFLPLYRQMEVDVMDEAALVVKLLRHLEPASQAAMWAATLAYVRDNWRQLETRNALVLALQDTAFVDAGARDGWQTWLVIGVCFVHK